VTLVKEWPVLLLDFAQKSLLSLKLVSKLLDMSLDLVALELLLLKACLSQIESLGALILLLVTCLCLLL
jgi:predicted HTH domain antitoxin